MALHTPSNETSIDHTPEDLRPRPAALWEAVNPDPVHVCRGESQTNLMRELCPIVLTLLIVIVIFPTDLSYWGENRRPDDNGRLYVTHDQIHDFKERQDGTRQDNVSGINRWTANVLGGS